VVTHGARGTGLGIALVETLEDAAVAMGISRLVLLTRTARSFFEHRGYSVIPRESAPEAVRTSAEFRIFCPAPAVCMTKSLDRTTQSTPNAPLMRVLFLCTGNSCRSILGEATFNHLAPSGWRAMSAGSKPTGKVHPRSLALLAREGIGIDGYFSKSWDDLPQTPDIVITVCASAAGEACPVYLGPVLRTHWGVDDPAHATGTDAEIDAQFFKAYRTLRNRIEAFLALPLDQLRQDPARLKAELDRIGATVA
jgi:arsenate reductase